jgi:hypothetical protein
MAHLMYRHNYEDWDEDVMDGPAEIGYYTDEEKYEDDYPYAEVEEREGTEDYHTEGEEEEDEEENEDRSEDIDGLDEAAIEWELYARQERVKYTNFGQIIQEMDREEAMGYELDISELFVFIVSPLFDGGK